MRYSVSMTGSLHAAASDHLLQTARQEDLCFALWHPSNGAERETALVYELITPKRGERLLHGNAGFTSEYFQRAMGIALKKGAGLAFMHSHLGPGWQNMSDDDFLAELRMAPAVKSATTFPLVGLTLATDDSWSARFWTKDGPRIFSPKWCETVRVIGESGLSVTFADNLLPPPLIQETQSRTVSAWGESVQNTLSRLRIGVVGLGSVGGIVSEALARMGIQSMKIMDYDSVELVNLDRLLNVSLEDVGKEKIQVCAKALKKSATAKNFTVEPLDSSVVEEEGFREILDCDIIFSCVDRPWPRAVLNLVAYAHLIPVIDGGIRAVTKKSGKFRGADWKAHAVFPSRRCLECLGQYNPADVQLQREGYLDDAEYIESLNDDHPFKQRQNVFSFSLDTASLEILQMLSIVVRPLGVSNFGEYNYHFATGHLDINHGAKCKDRCPYTAFVAMGDAVDFKVTGRDSVAELARNANNPKPKIKNLLRRLLRRL